jgi:multiple sugar transport system substrate-binding protein
MNMRIAVVILAGLILAVPGASGEDLWMQAYAYDMPGEGAYYEKLAEDYAASGGGDMRITLDKWDHAHEQIAQWCAAEEGPDLVVVPDIWLAEFAPHIEDLTPLLPSAMAEEFFDVLYTKALYKGRLLGLVWATSTKALFYRTDLFEAAGLAPPTNWTEQLAAALVLNDPPRMHGIGLPGAREYETDDNLFFYFWSAGGQFFDESGKCALNSEAGVKALRFYCDLVNRHHVTQPEVTTWTRKQTRRLFQDGKLAMFATGPWGIQQLRKDAPDIPFGVVPLPKDKELVTQIITDHLVLSRHSTRKEEAARFIQFAYEDARRLDFVKLGLVPEKKAVAVDDYFQNDPHWKVFVDVIPYGRTIPLIKWEPVGIAIREAMHQALTGRMTPKTALDGLAAQIDEILSQQAQAK